MDIERAVVSKIISTGLIEDAISKGIRDEHFADDECRDMFAYIKAHARKYKSAPSSQVVREEKPGFEFLLIQDSLDYLLDRFIVVVKRRFAQEMAVELAKAADDPERGPNIDLEFLEVSRKLATLVPSTQVSKFKEGMDKRIDDYERRVREGEKFGIPFGFETLDEWTGGIQPHEFVTVQGFSGLGKSTMLMQIAFNAWVQGYTPLYISLEMEAGAILRKFDAMAASLDYKLLKGLELPKQQIKNWREKREEIKEHVAEIPVIDSLYGATPDHVYAETVRHEPDLVLVDYLSLMRTGRAGKSNSLWQTLTEITQDLKQNARTLKIPILAAAQTNRSGAKDGADLDNVGQSISVVQDSDIVLGLHADEDMKMRKEMEIRLNKNRDGRLGKINAIWDHEGMNFRQKVLGDSMLRGE